MKLILKIEMNNSAFEDFPDEELPRILHSLARTIDERGLMEAGHDNRCDLYDINGNAVGFAGVYEDHDTPKV